MNRSDLSGDVFLDLKKAFVLFDHKILLSKLPIYLNNSNLLLPPNSPPPQLRNSAQNVFSSVVPTLLRVILNIVYHMGETWDLYTFASIIMTYPYILNQTLQHAICAPMTQQLTQPEKVSCRLRKHYRFVLTTLVWLIVTVHKLINPVKTKSMLIITKRKHHRHQKNRLQRLHKT